MMKVFLLMALVLMVVLVVLVVLNRKGRVGRKTAVNRRHASQPFTKNATGALPPIY